MNRRRNLILLGIGLVLVVLVGALAVGRPKHEAIEAKLETVAYTHFITRLPETGVVQRPQIQTLSALVPGNIARVRVSPGDHVAPKPMPCCRPRINRASSRPNSISNRPNST
jgi:hypothetical protein